MEITVSGLLDREVKAAYTLVGGKAFEPLTKPKKAKRRNTR